MFFIALLIPISKFKILSTRNIFINSELKAKSYINIFSQIHFYFGFYSIFTLVILPEIFPILFGELMIVLNWSYS